MTLGLALDAIVLALEVLKLRHQFGLELVDAAGGAREIAFELALLAAHLVVGFLQRIERALEAVQLVARGLLLLGNGGKLFSELLVARLKRLVFARQHVDALALRFGLLAQPIGNGMCLLRVLDGGSDLLLGLLRDGKRFVARLLGCIEFIARAAQQRGQVVLASGKLLDTLRRLTHAFLDHGGQGGHLCRWRGGLGDRSRRAWRRNGRLVRYCRTGERGQPRLLPLLLREPAAKFRDTGAEGIDVVRARFGSVRLHLAHCRPNLVPHRCERT